MKKIQKIPPDASSPATRQSKTEAEAAAKTTAKPSPLEPRLDNEPGAHRQISVIDHTGKFVTTTPAELLTDVRVHYRAGVDAMAPWQSIVVATMSDLFPPMIANELRTLVLKYYTRHCPNATGHIEPDNMAIMCCYYSTHGKRAVRARRAYRRRILQQATADFQRRMPRQDFDSHELKAWLNRWVKINLQEFVKTFNSDLSHWITQAHDLLRLDFETAYSAGLFNEDVAAYESIHRQPSKWLRAVLPDERYL